MTGASKTLRNHLWIFNPCMDLPLDLAGAVWEKPLLSCSDLQSHQAAYRQDKNSICCGLWKLIIKYYTTVGDMKWFFFITRGKEKSDQLNIHFDQRINTFESTTSYENLCCFYLETNKLHVFWARCQRINKAAVMLNDVCFQSLLRKK